MPNDTTSLKSYIKLIACCLLLFPVKHFAQHQIAINAVVDNTRKTILIDQTLTYYNQSGDTLTSIVLNDWNNSYSSKNTPLAKRFSDEFVRSFHLAKDEERGSTNDLRIFDETGNPIIWIRPENHPDLAEITLASPLLPGEKRLLTLKYEVKIPSDRFTRYGYTSDGGMILQNWFISPARYDSGGFSRYSNNNLDDIANAVSDYDLTIQYPSGLELTSDLNQVSLAEDAVKVAHLAGQNRINFSLFLEPKSTFLTFANDLAEVENSIKSSKVDDVQKAIIVDRIVRFTSDMIGKYPHQKITVSETDYAKNPFYGLNQLPSFINVFPDEFLYELKFLKTYLNNYLKSSVELDPRKENWIYDGMQVYAMMRYVTEFHPNVKMTGSLSPWKILKSYNFNNLPFNEQYSYIYMLMARKNLDQPVGDPKNTLIKFNEQIAGKYRAGLSLRYLDSYLENGIVDRSIKEFFEKGKRGQVDESAFDSILQQNAGKNLDWFFKTIIHSRDLVDYKFTKLQRGADSITVTVKNKTGAIVPIPVYGVKHKKVIFKQWLEGIAVDSTITLARGDADRLVLNYQNEVPEYNLRNNWKSLKSYRISNRPIKFVFFKDLEDPYYNQVLYVPTLSYNLYDGLMPGIRFYNKTFLDKPFTYDINPAYSLNTESFSGSMSLAVLQNIRNGSLYNVRYAVSGSYFHYAPDATYSKYTPTVQFRFRPSDFRDNRKQLISLRQVTVHREASEFVSTTDTENYSIFNARYINTRTEVTNHVNFIADFQAAPKFGKASVEMQYRKLFDNNRQVTLRGYAGTFLYNRTTSQFFDFALDRPTDYLFDYNYYGRSETTGLFSQQLILAEGGFKSKLDMPFANQWITTLNAGFNIWNWIEVYGDAGLVKNRNLPAEFVYDSGIRLNLVTDYFELYFPVYSNKGWEIAQPNYSERIRFIVTLSPGTLLTLFTRKWF